MTTLTTAPVKTITYDRLTGDYKMELDGEFVGYAACYHLAEIELDRLAYERLNAGPVEPELALSATALDSGSSQDEIAAEHAENLTTAIHLNGETSTRTHETLANTPSPATRECERCGSPWSSFRDLRIQTDNGEITPVGVRLCDPCYRDGEKIEPIRDLTAFLAGPYAGRPGATDWADPGHDITLPDPAECPDVSAPQPVEDLPTCFILPTGTTAQSVILCVGGVSRVVSAQGVAEALALASVHQVTR